MAFYPASSATFPASNFATHDLTNNRRVVDFDASADETCYIEGYLPSSHGGGGLTVVLFFSTTDDTDANKVRWDVDFERVNTAITADSFTGSPQSLSVLVNATINVRTAATIAFTEGGQMDSLAAGEEFRLEIKRVATHGDDTCTTDASLSGVAVYET